MALDAVLDNFTESWERGEHPRAERYLGFLPAEDSAELIYHEYCLAEASDLAPDPADYLRRFPEHVNRLSRLFALHGAIPSSTLLDWAGPANLPSDGDEIGPYHLLRELGRGAFARVFLAEQADLEHRLVVLKVSTRLTAEPRLLARATHPHIVEVLRHAATEDGSLHLVCMPFLGGATLASVLDVRRTLGRKPRSGRDFLADLDRASAPEYLQAGPARPARDLLDSLSHPKALAWVVARLAEALDHADVRGVVHGDLKPSNVLITADGVPLLLDMNLATDRRGDGLDGDADGPVVDLGGTLAYMAPERLEAIAQGGEGLRSKPLDRHRADLYALGLVLLEAVTGQAPEVPTTRAGDARTLAGALAGARRSLPRALLVRGGRRIPPALRSILAKCLAPHPLDRYARGDELAEDLDRWRSARPLAFAEEPRRSVLSRSARQCRFPLIAMGVTLAAAVSVAWFASMVLQGTKRDQALAKYSMIDRADSGAFLFRRFGDWRGAERGDPVEFASRLLARYDVLNDPDWQSREDVQSLPDRERGELEAWLFEQVLRYVAALGRRPDSPEDWRRGLDLLDRILARVSSEPLQVERASLRAKLKRPDSRPTPADRPRLSGWMDDYLAGVAAEPLQAREALDHYLDALRGRPDHFWAHYRAAVVACRIDEYPIAAEHLRACVARNSENPILHLQLASVLYRVNHSTMADGKPGDLAEALEACDRAAALDPDYAPANHIRAQIRKASGQRESVNADVARFELQTRLRSLGAFPKLGQILNLHPGPNYVLPLEFEAIARRAVEEDPIDEENRTILGAVLGIQDRSAESIAEYDRVLAANPEHLRARYQRALQLIKLDPPEAISEFAALIEHPRFEELFCEDPAAFRAYHHVATDLMDQGKVAQALEVAHRSLVHVNRSRSLSNDVIHARRRPGNQLKISPRGETYYLLARIYAVAARTDLGQVAQVIENLGIAFAKTPRLRDGWFANDPHFDGLRAEILVRLPPVASTR